MAKKIRDPIHGYIYLTELEVYASSDELFLRLHNIHQNSFTYLTYPSTHNTRYPHSLGVLHVAGEMLNHALTNSNDKTLSSLASTVFIALTSVLDSTRAKSIIDSIEAADLYSVDPYYRHFFVPSALDQKQEAVWLKMLQQALRLAALLHDVGHPPFSHIVEYALQQSMGSYTDHEKISARLARMICTKTLARLETRNFISLKEQKSFCAFAAGSFELALAILEKRENFPLLGFTRTLYSGNVDADRIDYVIRDITAAGIVAFTYDLGRLLDSCLVRKNPEDEHYELALSANCLSSIEVLFGARFHLYRWMIYHHDVSRRNLAVQRALIYLLDPSYRSELPKGIHPLIDQFTAMAADWDRYYEFVDGYLLNFLYQVNRLIEAQSEEDITHRSKDVKLFLDVVLFRRNDHLRSLWKRPDEYHEFCDRLKMKGKGGAIEKFNGGLRAVYEKKFERYKKLGRLRFAQELERRINEELGSPPRVFAYYFGEFEAAPTSDFRLFSGKDKPISVENLSPALAALREAWQASPQLMLYYEVDDTSRNWDRTAAIEHYHRATKTAIAKMLKQ